MIYVAGPLLGGILGGYYTHLNRIIVEEKPAEDLEEAAPLRGEENQKAKND